MSGLVGTRGAQAAETSADTVMSSDGGWVGFWSKVDDLVGIDSDLKGDICFRGPLRLDVAFRLLTGHALQFWHDRRCHGHDPFRD